MASHFSVSAWEMGQKFSRQREERVNAWEVPEEHKAHSHCYQSLVCNVFFHTTVENPTCTSREECESITTLLPILW